VQSSQRAGEKRMRRHARVAIGEGVRARVGAVDLRVVNCSASGALLLGPISTRPGELLDVEMRLPARNVSVKARVIRHDRTPQGMMTALQLENPSKEAVELLARTVDAAMHTPDKLNKPLVLFDPREGDAMRLLACARELGCQTESRRSLEAALAFLKASPFRTYAIVAAREAPPNEVSQFFRSGEALCPLARRILFSDNSWMSAAEVSRAGAHAVLRELNLRADLSSQLSEARWRDASRNGGSLR